MRVQGTFDASDCAETVYDRGWPGRCSRKAKHMGSFAYEIDGEACAARVGLCQQHFNMFSRNPKAGLTIRDAQLNPRHPYLTHGEFVPDVSS